MYFYNINKNKKYVHIFQLGYLGYVSNRGWRRVRVTLSPRSASQERGFQPGQ